MSNRVRYVYILIEKVDDPNRFTKKELDGLDRAEAWNLFQTKEQEIEEWGDRLLRRFEKKEGQSITVFKKDRIKKKTLIFGSTKVLRHGDGAKPLEVIKEGRNAVIYVHCHGNSEVVGLRPKKLTPAQLAARLAEDGLPKGNTPVIKLWSCHSGEIYGSGDRRFVDLFTEALGKEEGYVGVEVYGYEGALYVSKGTKAKTSTDSNKVQSRASDKRTEAVFSRA
jgi:hypothetical protein